ncbi:MAG TPA: exonuclease SbcCD subunit D [Acidimicrobiia bacterium]|nr:exonuclease SbcCD subunit D [Acidimicrobiia bacterium]
MRLLHTADWHVGKQLRGRSRLDEHRRVLGEIVQVATRAEPDVVLVVGDLFESSAPVPDAQRLVWDTLLALRATGAHVAVVAGNHDSPFGFDAVRPLCAAAGITVLGHPAPPDHGGVVELDARDGSRVRLALLPFPSQRYAVRAEALWELTGSGAVGEYRERIRRMVDRLCDDPPTDAVTVLAAHLTVMGAAFGGGERQAQSVFDYHVPASVFPSHLHYVALGHLHRTQSVGGGAPAWYSGSPIQVDFGEEADDKHVLVVDAEPGVPARVEAVRLTTPDRLQTLRGTLDELRAAFEGVGDAWLRVVVTEASRAGLADEVRALAPRVVDVRIEAPATTARDNPAVARSGRSPHDLFVDYLAGEGVADDRLVALFDRLLAERSEEQPA